MTEDMSKSHRSTYEAIFLEPVPQRLAWRDVKSMLDEVGEVIDLDNGSFKVRCGGEGIVLHPGRNKVLSDERVINAIRDFLKRAGAKRAAGGMPSDEESS